MNIRNFGGESVDEVRDKLVSLGLKFKDSVPGFDGAYFQFSLRRRPRPKSSVFRNQTG
jgi:hypothetical protein